MIFSLRASFVASDGPLMPPGFTLARPGDGTLPDDGRIPIGRLLRA